MSAGVLTRNNPHVLIPLPDNHITQRICAYLQKHPVLMIAVNALSRQIHRPSVIADREHRFTVCFARRNSCAGLDIACL